MDHQLDHRNEHVVFFAGAGGAPAFRRLPSLDEAVRFVEHLRNDEGVAEVSVYSLAEVALSFRPYYRVEVGATESAVASAPAPVEPAPLMAVEELPEAPVEQLEQVDQPEPALPAPDPGPAYAEEPVAEDLVPSAREESTDGRRGLAFFAS